jgi:hypothetical protein
VYDAHSKAVAALMTGKIKFFDQTYISCEITVSDNQCLALTRKNMRYQVLTAASMNMAVIWGFATCSLLDYQTTLHDIPEDSHLHVKMCFAALYGGIHK